MLPFLPDAFLTARLRLRRPHADDASALFNGYAQDAKVCCYLVWRPHQALAETEKFLSLAIAHWDGGMILPYVITAHDNNAAIGMIEARRLGAKVELGYVLAREHWGKGLMTEAIEVLTSAALHHAEIFRVEASCDVENIASQRALEKSAFTLDTRLNRYTIHPNISATPRPCFIYANCR